MFDATTRGFYNHIEPFIWYVVAILLIPALRKHAPIRQRLVFASIVCVFGTSDFYETEAWWTPWWLFLWKAISLGAMCLMGLHIRTLSRRAAPSDPVASDGAK
jgi:hypothetical protein